MKKALHQLFMSAADIVSNFVNYNHRYMKKQLLLLFIIAIAGMVNAQSLLKESFNYTAGTLTGNGSWTTAAANITVVAGSLSSSTYQNASGTVGNKVALVNASGTQNSYKVLSSTVTSGDIFVSFLVNVSSMGNATGQCVAGLLDGTSGSTYRLGFFIQNGTTVGTNVKFGIGVSNSSTKGVTGDYNVGTTYLIVLRARQTVSKTIDSVWMYVNPNLTAGTLPSTYDIRAFGNTSLSTGFGAFSFRNTSSASYACNIDELKVGTSWTYAPEASACATNPAITSVTAASSPICNSSTTTLTANGTNGVNPVVTWWSGTGGTGTNYGTGTTSTKGPGTYYARVTGDCGTAAEASVTVAAKVDVAIGTITSPANSICAAATQTLTVNTVTGTNATTNWYTLTGGGGTLLGTGLTLANAGPGTYYARVTGDCGAAVEATKTISTTTATGISTQPAGTSYIQNATPSNLSLVATGASLAYEWHKSSNSDGSSSTIVGTNSSTYLPSSATVGTQYYFCIVSGTCTPSVTSDIVTVNVTAPLNPAIGLTSSLGTDAQTITTGTTITNIDYTWGGSATTATVSWTGTLNGSTPPSGISVNTSGPVSISGTPTVEGNYGYTVLTDGSPAASASGTITVKLTAPSVASANPIANSSFTANWSSVTNATSYDLYVYPSNNGTGTPLTGFNPINVSGTSQSVTSLSEATAYSYKVVAKAAGLTSSDLSVYQSVTTTSPSVSIGAWTTGTGSFSNQVVNTVSGEQVFTVSGTNLDGNIIITPPVGFQISTTSGSGYVSNPSTISLTLNGSNGVSSTPIYVIFAPTTVAGSVSANITIASTNITTQNNAVSGISIAIVPTATSTILTGSTSGSQTILTLSLPASGGGNKRIIIGKQGASTTITPSNATSYTSQTASSIAFSTNLISSGNYVIYNGAGSGPITVTGLSASTQYTFTIYEYNDNAGVGQNYYTTGNSATFTTPAPGSITAGNATYAMTSSGTTGATLDGTGFTSSNITAAAETASGFSLGTSGSLQKATMAHATLTTTDYLQFTFTPKTGYSLASISASINASVVGVYMTMSYSTDGTLFTQFMSQQTLTATHSAYSNSLTGVNVAALQTLYIRVYLYGSGTAHFSNFVLNGNMIAGTGGCTTPATYTVGGGGAYCSNLTGVNVTLSGSESGTNYQLYNGVSAVGSPKSGTGSAITFNNTTSAGTYTVVGTNSCGSSTMSGSAIVSINPIHTISLTSASGTDVQAACLNTAITDITYSVGNGATSASVTGLPAGVSGSYSGGVYTISGSPSVSAGSPYHYTVTTSGGNSCTVTATGTITVNTLPTPSFTVAPTVVAANYDETYTTQSGQSNYVWSFSGVLSTDYTITSGGSSSDNSVTVKWLTTGTQSVSVNYANSNGCSASSATTTNTTVNNNLIPPTLTAASGATVDAPFDVTFTDDGTWAGSITGITINGTALTTGYSVSTNKITFTPSASVPAGLLQTSGANKSIAISSANGYNDAPVSQTIAVGIDAQLSIITQPSSAATFGGSIGTPVVSVLDQYGNTTNSAASISVSINTGNSLSGTVSANASAGTATFSGLGASTLNGVTTGTAQLTFASTGLTSATSNTFSIAAYISFATDYFRSNATGSWSTPGTWQSSPDNTNWYTATIAPGTSASSVVIRSGNIVTASSAITTNNVIINSGGELDFNTGGSIVLNATKTLTVNGTIVNAVTGSDPLSGVTTTFNSGAVLNLTAAATTTAIYIPIATWNIGSLCKISGLVGAITSGAPADYTGLTGVNQNFANFEVNCPNLIGKLLLTNNGGTMAIKGDLTITDTHTGMLQFCKSTTQNTLVVTGNYSQTGGTAYIVQNTSSAATRTLTVNGTFSLSGTAIFDILNSSGSSSSNIGVLNVKGNVSVGTGATLRSSNTSGTVAKLTFTGTSAQTIQVDGSFTATSPASVNVELNNSNGLTLNSPLTLNGTLTLTNGILTSTNINILTLAAGVAVSGGSNTSYVSGPMQNTIASATAKTIIFPIGKSSHYSPVTLNITQSAATSTTYKAEVFVGATTPDYIKPGTISAVSANRYYTLSSSGNLISTASINLVYDATDATVGGISVNSPSNIKIAAGDGTNWTDLNLTTAGSSGSITSDVNFTTLGDFVLGNAIIKIAAPTLGSVTGATVDASFNIPITGYDANWTTDPHTISFGSYTLVPADYILTDGNLELIPSATNGLGVASTQNLTITTLGYDNALLSNLTIGAGVPAKLQVKLPNSVPSATNGAAFTTQPAVYIQDQYGNLTTSTATVTASASAGWTLGGTAAVAAVAGTATFSGLTSTANAAVTGATITFTYSVGAVTFSVNSTSFNLAGPPSYYWVGGSTSAALGAIGTVSTSLGGIPNASVVTFTASDILIFDGSDISSNVGLQTGGTINATNNASGSTVTLGGIVVQNNANVTITFGSGRTINLNKTTGNAFSVDYGSSLTFSGGSNATVNLPAGTKGSVDGILNLGNGSGNDQIIVNDAGALVFGSHANVTVNSGSNTFYPFGSGTAGSVIFQSGSILTNTKFADPFGGAGRSVVTFQSGSTYNFNNSGSASAFLLDGNTYANLTIGANATPPVGTANGFTINGNLTVNTGTFTIAETGASSIKGNISVASGANLTMSPASATTLTLNGASSQSISGAGTITLSGSQSLTINNTAGVTLGKNIIVPNTLTLTAGNLTIGSNTLTAGNITGAANLVGSTTSNIILSGTTASALGFSSGNVLGSLTLSGGTGCTATLGSDLGIATLLSLSGTGSKLDINGHKLTIKSSATGTAEVGQVKGTIVDGLLAATNITVERYIPQGKRNYRDLGPTVANAGSVFANWQESGAGSTNYSYGVYITGKNGTPGYAAYDPTTGFDFTTNGNATPSLYSCVSGNWSAVTTSTGGTKGINLDPFKGLRLLIRGARNFNMGTNPANMPTATTLRATGSLVTGTVTFYAIGSGGTVSSVYTSTYGLTPQSAYVSGEGWSFIANPYACPVSWSAILANSGTNVGNFYCFLDPTYQNGGLQRYVTVQYTGSTIVTNRPAGIATDAACLNIQPGQGFWVYHTVAAPKVVIQETNKVVGGTQTTVFRTAKSNMLNVSIWKDLDGVSTSLDETVATFDNNYSKSFGDEDVMKLMNGGENISIIESNTDLSINGIALPSIGDEIALRVGNVTANTAYQLKVDASQFEAPGVQAFIKDALLNTIVPAETVVNFTPTSDANTYKNRFSVVFKSAKVVPVTTVKGNISVYPNPVTSKTFTLQTANVAAGKYNVVIVNSLGQEVFNTTINHTEGSTMETIKMNKSVSGGLYTVVLRSSEGKVVYNTELLAK